MNVFWLTLLGTSFASVLALRNSSDPSDTLPSLINTTSSSTPSANRQIDWFCQSYIQLSGTFGRSCFDAVRQVAFVPGSATRQFSWGPRGRAKYDVYLPQKVYSCMGFPIYRVFI